MVFSYLQHRSRSVRIGTNHSSYSRLNDAIRQGSWLGPLSFLLFINDLRPDCLTELLYTTVQNLPVCNSSFNNCSVGLIRMIWFLISPKLKKWFLVRPLHQIYLTFPPALIKYKEPARLNYLVSTLILIFLGTLMSRPCNSTTVFSQTA